MTDNELEKAVNAQLANPVELIAELESLRAWKAEIEKQEPVAWAYTINNTHSVFSAEKPPEDAYDEGTLYPLYAAPVISNDVEVSDDMLLSYQVGYEKGKSDSSARIAELEAEVARFTKLYDDIENSALSGMYAYSEGKLLDRLEACFEGKQAEITALRENIKVARAALTKAVSALVHASGHVDNEDFAKVMMARDAVNEALATIGEE